MKRFHMLVGIFLILSNHIKASSKGDVQAILKKGELHIGIMSDDRWPFFYSDTNGKLKGIDVEIAERFAQSLGVKAKITRNTLGFKSTLDAISKHEFDVAFSAFYPTVSRATRVRFSDPYCTLNGVFISKRVSKKNTSKKIIGTFDSTLFESALRNRFENSQVLVFNKRSELWESLKNEKIDSIYADDLEVIKTQNENKNFNLFYKVETDNESTYPVAASFGLKSQELTELLNLWIKNETAIGNLKRICALGVKK